MSRKRKTALWVVVLAVAVGAVGWHVVSWHLNGTYLEMFRWPEEGRGYLTALYNLGAMLVLGVLLGFLTDKIISLLGLEVGEDGDDKGGNRRE